VVTFNDASDPAMQETEDFNVVVLRKTNIIDGRFDEKQLLPPIWLLLRNKVRDPTVPLADARFWRRVNRSYYVGAPG
jgi:hypothetical protein